MSAVATTPTRRPRRVTPLDPTSAAGIAAAEALNRALAEIQVAIWRRRTATTARKATA